MASKDEPVEDNSSVPSLDTASQSTSNELSNTVNTTVTQSINTEHGTSADDVTTSDSSTSQHRVAVDEATGESLPPSRSDQSEDGLEATDPTISNDDDSMDFEEAGQLSSTSGNHGNSPDNNEVIGGGDVSQSVNEEETPDSDSSIEKLWSEVVRSEDRREKEEANNKLKGAKSKPKNAGAWRGGGAGLGGGGRGRGGGGSRYMPKIRIPKEPSFWSSRDTIAYRKGYPGKKDHPLLDLNYQFYTNQTFSKPNGNFIDVIHEEWWGEYDHLEGHHGYIQWLFPIRESGLNWHSQELQLHEIKKICADRKAHERVIKSYEMMLDFYGMKLDRKDGSIQRADNWKDRFRHLNRSMHNYLRITRILKCLGEFGYEHYKLPFVRFVLREAIVERTLVATLESCMNYWVEVIKKDEERKEIRQCAHDLVARANSEQERRKT